MNTERNKETGLVYRGREDRVHIADGQRAEQGYILAGVLEDNMREDEFLRLFVAGADPDTAARESHNKPLCPGCYMTAVFNMAVKLAQDNGQSLRELGRTLAGEFQRLAEGGPSRIEEVRVVLDSEN